MENRLRKTNAAKTCFVFKVLKMPQYVCVCVFVCVLEREKERVCVYVYACVCKCESVCV